MVLKYQEQESTALGSAPEAPIDNAYIVGCSGFYLHRRFDRQ